MSDLDQPAAVYPWLFWCSVSFGKKTLLLLLLLLLTDICLRKLMYITNAHAVNSHERILLSPEKERFKEFFK